MGNSRRARQVGPALAASAVSSRSKAAPQSGSPADGPALPVPLKSALQSAAAVLARQIGPQFDQDQAASIRAVDAVFAEYAR